MKVLKIARHGARGLGVAMIYGVSDPNRPSAHVHKRLTAEGAGVQVLTISAPIGCGIPLHGYRRQVSKPWASESTSESRWSDRTDVCAED